MTGPPGACWRSTPLCCTSLVVALLCAAHIFSACWRPLCDSSLAKRLSPAR
eukprot:CAMPEP_0119115332 /NCGR_PEP_ID=MMETSP1180-20130426/50606_1 /TAXON_ID=3052 ORGANISM="Chlamydomonas cf sp, Strain CCMP681" /NCGR_SAMPLE_ID=MMETSP1180 /ASSEMBLY_ACC=CAM_ASM_000741 /LENGTH=50 /DNA_ID=CAMNT_0007104255 /DNA_START=715 /DNA_END=867 /DNA_ORIENTATION=+